MACASIAFVFVVVAVVVFAVIKLMFKGEGK